MKKTITLFALFLFFFSLPASAQWWKFWEKKDPCTYMHRGHSSYVGVVCADWSATNYEQYDYKGSGMPTPSWIAYVDSIRKKVDYSFSIKYKPETPVDKDYNILLFIRYDSEELEYIGQETTRGIPVDYNVYPEKTGLEGKGTIVMLFDVSGLRYGNRIEVNIRFEQKSENDDINRENRVYKLKEYNKPTETYKFYCDVYGLLKPCPRNIPVEWYNPAANTLVENVMKNIVKEFFEKGFSYVLGFADIVHKMREVELPALYVIGPSRTITKEKTLAAPKPVRQMKPERAKPLPEKPKTPEPVKKVEPIKPLERTYPVKTAHIYKNEHGMLETELDYGIVMVQIPGGTFFMGSEEGYDDEKPVHQVRLDSYWIGKYEVTQRQWKEVMGNNPSLFEYGDDYPVENVTWFAVQNFIEKLNELTNIEFRLPTEAELENAIRAGTNTRYHFGNELVLLDEYAWYEMNSGRRTHPVGQKKPNRWGLYDIIGNVWEWCSDWYGGYKKIISSNPTGPTSGQYRLLRGGCWACNSDFQRSSRRVRHSPQSHYNYLGLRLVHDGDLIQKFQNK